MLNRRHREVDVLCGIAFHCHFTILSAVVIMLVQMLELMCFGHKHCVMMLYQPMDSCQLHDYVTKQPGGWQCGFQPIM